METEILSADFQVMIQGNAQERGDIKGLIVRRDISAPGFFELRLNNRKQAGAAVILSDDPRFTVGNAVEINMGYLGELKPVMTGEITGLELESHAGVELLTVRGHDRGHRLLRGRKTRSFTQVKVSDIARKVAQDAGLSCRAEDTQVTLEYVLQHNQTDWEFLETRARRVGFEILVDGKTLEFRPHKNDGSEVVTLSRDSDLIEFYPRLSTLGLVGEVTVQGWSPKDKEAILGKAKAGAEGTTMGGSTGGPAAADKAFDAAVATVVDLGQGVEAAVVAGHGRQHAGPVALVLLGEPGEAQLDAALAVGILVVGDDADHDAVEAVAFPVRLAEEALPERRIDHVAFLRSPSSVR